MTKYQPLEKNIHELPLMLDVPYFTQQDIADASHDLIKRGVSPTDIRYSFDRRVDLSGLPWQLYAQAEVDTPAEAGQSE